MSSYFEIELLKLALASPIASIAQNQDGRQMSRKPLLRFRSIELWGVFSKGDRLCAIG
ncbi:hypothetical protein QUA74_03020 [Microcoleus sp. LAD1_D3]|uniref:hypothetical protein n=1 Tax=Microcoleus sp. LAD1_D3 TaxID=2819365 RepID=UPI002FD46FCB